MKEKTKTIYECDTCGEMNDSADDVQTCAICDAEVCAKCGVNLNFGWAINTTSMNDMTTCIVCSEHFDDDGQDKIREFAAKKIVKMKTELKVKESFVAIEK